ncbi:putative fumarylacetoacetate hydrolase [Aspergillus steynii IBT 23096]|uniref:Putative fumarylacetoacetate hydrolase n=1 Tax=Aspergillus steynii IBT 23096 TaxID=1392250 RepID=A0A2I2G3L0_9EURO|nr:putative fumarylacetoacetate hydrolase [Aspergillus steynii IBT 23096]PLB47461.1 putative fumarylacetoacetate hydrolase [Aspergillus steynii IBT 23096]
MAPSKINYCVYVDPTAGTPRVGHLVFGEEQITPLSFSSGTRVSDLYQVIEAGDERIRPAPEEALSLSQVQLLPPISGRDILAVGKNYAEHAKEFNSSGFDASDKNDQPTRPVIFTKRATSIIAHGEEVLLHPEFTETPDYEGEIGVIIGKAGHRIREAEAMDHVWGYTIINDVTARERQRDHKQFFLGKSPDTYCPMGPVAVRKEHLPTNPRLQTFVNGEKRQDATLDQLIFSIPTLIACLSQGQTLQPGDTIATGTPVGVGFGFRPMKFLQPGDEVHVSVTGLGTLVNRMATADAPNTTIQRVQARSAIPRFNQKTRQRHGLLQVGGKELFYQFQGHQEGAPVIFIHGLGGSSGYFTPLVTSLAATHALYLTDLEGHGLSPTSALSELTVASLAADVRDVYRQARPDRKPATVVAHSMGCLVAMKLALEYPELITGLVLMGPPPSRLSPAARSGCYTRAETVRNKGMFAVVDDILDAGLSSACRTKNPLAVTATRLSLLGQDPEGYAKACTALAGSADEILDPAQLTCRTLILTGSEDVVSPPAVCDAYANAIQSSRMKVLDEVGHWHLFENDRDTSDAVLSFLADQQ